MTIYILHDSLSTFLKIIQYTNLISFQITVFETKIIELRICFYSFVCKFWVTYIICCVAQLSHSTPGKVCDPYINIDSWHDLWNFHTGKSMCEFICHSIWEITQREYLCEVAIVLPPSSMCDVHDCQLLNVQHNIYVFLCLHPHAVSIYEWIELTVRLWL